jgi:hypothetical protein
VLIGSDPAPRKRLDLRVQHDHRQSPRGPYSDQHGSHAALAEVLGPLNVRRTGRDRFRRDTGALRLSRLFGGQAVAQALMARGPPHRAGIDPRPGGTGASGKQFLTRALQLPSLAGPGACGRRIAARMSRPCTSPVVTDIAGATSLRQQYDR